MKRSFKTIISEGYEQFIKDIKQTKWAIIVIIAYFVFGRKFIYSICPLIMLTGYPCPSCGLTRAGIQLLHFDFAGAWHMHPFIYVVAILVFCYCWEPLYQASVKAAKEYEDTCRNRTCGTCDFLYLPHGVLFSGGTTDELLLWESAAYLQKFPCKFICTMILYNKFLIWISFRNLCQQNESVSNLLIILNNRIIRCQLL